MRIDNMAVLLVGLNIASVIILTMIFVFIKPFCKLILALGGM